MRTGVGGQPDFAVVAQTACVQHESACTMAIMVASVRGSHLCLGFGRVWCALKADDTLDPCAPQHDEDKDGFTCACIACAVRHAAFCYLAKSC